MQLSRVREMNRYNRLISRISAELSIQQGTNEPQDSFISRVVYSAIGQAAKASLYDVREDREPVTVQHLKKRVETLCTTYLELYPELKDIFTLSPEDFAGKVYSTLLLGGCIDHEPHRISPSAYTQAQSGQVVFVRGAPLNQRVCVSGLGTYQLAGTNSDSSAALMFGLQRISLAEQWEQLTSNLELRDFNNLEQVEFLRTEPDFKRGYFKPQPDTDGKISLMRTTMQATPLYYLYRLENGKIFAAQLPSWRTGNSEYRRISNAIIHNRGTLTSAVFHIDGEIVSLHLQYLYPPSELNFLKLYSWPGANDFNYILSSPVFHAVRSELERIGYTFTEE